MICQVKMIRPDGSRACHTGHYANPGAAMDVVQALHPDCAVHVATGPATSTGPTARPSTATRSCDALGVCQHPSKACPTHTMCARTSGAHFFAPGTISSAVPGSSSDLHDGDAGWLLDTLLIDWVAGIAILVLLGIICGALA